MVNGVLDMLYDSNLEINQVLDLILFNPLKEQEGK